MLKQIVVCILLMAVCSRASDYQAPQLISKATLTALIAKSPVLQNLHNDIPSADNEQLSDWQEPLTILCSSDQLSALETSCITSCSTSERELGLSKLTLSQQTGLLELFHKLDMSDEYNLCKNKCLRQIKKNELLFVVSPSIGAGLKTNREVGQQLLTKLFNNLDLSGLFHKKKTKKREYDASQQHVSPDGLYRVELNSRSRHEGVRIKIRSQDALASVLYSTPLADCSTGVCCWSNNQRYVYISIKANNELHDESMATDSMLYQLDLNTGALEWLVTFDADIAHLSTSVDGEYVVVLVPSCNFIYVFNPRTRLGIKHQARFHAQEIVFSKDGTYMYINCPQYALRMNFGKMQHLIKTIAGLSLEQGILCHLLIRQKTKNILKIPHVAHIWKTIPKDIAQRIQNHL